VADGGRAGRVGGLVSFEGGGRRLTARLIDSDFIRYQHRFPADFDCSAEIAPTPFIEAVRRVSLVAERATPVQLAFKRDVVVIEARTDGRARGAESVPAQLSGVEQVISFNPQYLLDGLSAAAACAHARPGGTDDAEDATVGGGRIRFEFSSQAKPAVITWTTSREAAAEYDPDFSGNGTATATAVASSADHGPDADRPRASAAAESRPPAPHDAVTSGRPDRAAAFRYLVVQQRVPVPG
jgi:hypothetical protein